MKFGRFTVAVSLAALATAVQASAGEEVLYNGTPEWVVPADFEAAMAAGEEIVLYDHQIRLDGGVVTRFVDVAYAIDSTQALQRYGTLQFSWLPDKGDLHLHRLELIRDGEVLDLLSMGIKPEVIRRERGLERRSVDGELTAVIAVPGMQVGDVLRMASSTTLRDQALQDEMQASVGVVAEPIKIGMGRMRVSWPSESDVIWGTMGDIAKPAVARNGGDNVIEFALPIDKPEEMPADAPARFRVSPMVQFGTFSSWEEVSRVMAPHFNTAGTLESDGGIAAEIARIKATSAIPLEQAALALQLVQDEISYLTNGMNGGNYLPQSPQETWEKRFGDCKAKSLLLLAMLRELGIESEVVLVDSDFGDAVSISQPMPAAFDHMIVHARIDGLDYWLDGTDAGGRIDTIHEVPKFIWALPLREDGAGLVRLEQRWPKVADRSYTITHDARAGVDFPIAYEIEMVARGGIGAQLRDMAVEKDPIKLIGHANRYFAELVDDVVVYDAEYSYDHVTGIGRAKVKGMSFDQFLLERETATLEVSSATTHQVFNPDRARSIWRDIPYAVGGPYTAEEQVTYLLPDNGKGVQVEGVADLDTVAAGRALKRQSMLDGGTFRITDRISYVPDEIAPTEIREGKTLMRRVASGDPIIKIAEPTRYWELDNRELARRMEPFVVATDRLVEVLDDKAETYVLRALLAIYSRRYDTAIADLDKAIELGATTDAYIYRSSSSLYLGQIDQALDDAEHAFNLQGDIEAAGGFAQLLALAGRGDEALDLLDSLGLSGDDAVDMLATWSELSGYANRQDEAWERLEEMLGDRPDDETLLNSKCWLAGIWSHNLDVASPICDQAVTLSGQSAGVIDSRALVHYRQGRLDAALEDLDLALSKEPGLAASLYLRGLIRLERGDRKGREDILHAKRIEPEIELRYRAFGLTAK